MLNTISITPTRLLSLLPTMRESKYPVYLQGAPGLGKSAIVKTFAEQHNLKLYDVRLTQIEAADLRGLPMVDDVNNVTRWLKPEFLPSEGEVEAEGYDGSIIFLDELSTAEPRLQSSAYQLLLDRKVGEYKLPDSCYVLGAGNSVN